MGIGYGHVRRVLYAAALLTPFTALRFGAVGLGEILFALALLMMLALNGGTFRKAHSVLPLFDFWSVYLVLIVLGFFYNTIIQAHSSGTFDGAMFDFMAYLVILFVVIILGDERLYRNTTPKAFFQTIFMIWSVAYSSLYILSYFATEIYGLPLRYYMFYSPLVENVHQAAMITSAMPFIMWHLASFKNNIMVRVWCVISGFLFFLMALESGSTKALMAVVAGSIMAFLYAVIKRVTAHRSKFLRLSSWSLIIFMVMAIVTAYWDEAIFTAVQFFQENDGSSARENLYALGFNHGMNSFVFGYGPGPHINYTADSYSDAHNTTLTIFLQGGILAIIALIATFFRLTKSVSTYSLLLGSLVAILMYFLGGDILRRLPIWIIIIGVSYLSRESVFSVKK